MALVSVEDVRKVSKSLLLTDGISNSDISDAINEAKITVFSQIGETLDDSSIDDNNCPADIKQAIKQIAAADSIVSNYSNDKEAVAVADYLNQKAKLTINAIVAGKRRFSALKKQTIPLTVGFDSVQTREDIAVDRFLSNLDKYR